MFGSSKHATATAAPVAQEYDAASASWRPATRVVPPPPAPENTVLAEAERQQKSEGGFLKKVGGAVKAPLKWLPWSKSSDAEEAATAPKAQAAPNQKKAS